MKTTVIVVSKYHTETYWLKNKMLFGCNHIHLASWSCTQIPNKHFELSLSSLYSFWSQKYTILQPSFSSLYILIHKKSTSVLLVFITLNIERTMLPLRHHRESKRVNLPHIPNLNHGMAGRLMLFLVEKNMGCSVYILEMYFIFCSFLKWLWRFTFSSAATPLPESG